MPQLAGRRAVCVVLYSRADQTLSAPGQGTAPSKTQDRVLVAARVACAPDRPLRWK